MTGAVALAVCFALSLTAIVAAELYREKVNQCRRDQAKQSLPPCYPPDP